MIWLHQDLDDLHVISYCLLFPPFVASVALMMLPGRDPAPVANVGQMVILVTHSPGHTPRTHHTSHLAIWPGYGYVWPLVMSDQGRAEESTCYPPGHLPCQ